MIGQVGRRLGIVVVQLLILLALVFGLSLLLPGDAADVQSGDVYSAAQRARTRQLLGLDADPVTRFARWLGHLLTGDLGTSLTSGRPVAEVIGEPFLVTGLLAGLTTLLLVPLATIAGFAAGLAPGSVRDRLISGASAVLDSVPDFVLALLLVGYLAARLGWFPATALGVDLATLLAQPGYLVLPLVVTVARVAAPLVRLVRAGVVDTMERPYVAAARRLGVPAWSLLARHVAPNALGPAVQELGRAGDGLLSGVLVVEAVFVLPGVASALVAAIGDRDQPVILAVVLLTGVAAIGVNTAVDLIGRRLVPRRT